MRFFSHGAHHAGHLAKGLGHSAVTVGEYAGSLILAACVGPLLLVDFRSSLKLYEFVEYTMPEIFTASAKRAGSHFKDTFVEHEHCEQYT